MAQDKKSDGSQFQDLGGGRVADKEKGTVYSPNQISQMYEVSKKSLKKESKNRLYVIFAIVLLACIAVCFLAGCFNIGAQTPVSSKRVEKVQKHSYKILIDQWNEAVIAADLNRSFELPRDNTAALMTKLNTLLNETNHYKTYVEKNGCVMKSKSNTYIPSQMYADFLKENEIRQKINFTEKSSEDEIVKELKKILHSQYIDPEMLRKLAYLKDFKIFFEDNKKKFYKQGFSKYVTKFDTYMDAVNLCQK